MAEDRSGGAVLQALSSAVDQLSPGLEAGPPELLAALCSEAFEAVSEMRLSAPEGKWPASLLPTAARSEMRALGRRFCADSEPNAEGAARLGSLLEAALELRLERLSSRAFRLRSGGWLNPAGLLECPAARRAEQLHRSGLLPRSDARRLSSALETSTNEAQLEVVLAPWVDRSDTREPGSWVVQPSQLRRQSGAHYTPWALARLVAEQALAPLVRSASCAQDILQLRILDPSVGGGVFLLAAAEVLTEALLRQKSPPALERGAAQAAIVSQCLFGVDTNASAIRLTQVCLHHFSRLAPKQQDLLQQHVVWGDALSGAVEPGGASLPEAAGAAPPIEWRQAFGDVFDRAEPGFDAVLGNPPWVAYVGRAAQPLSPQRADHYRLCSPAFRSYKTLHGVFIHRAAQLLKQGGRLGLLVPTSVCDLLGYGPTRAAHDALCKVDEELPDWEERAFPGVFQPCMALLSTRTKSVESRSYQAPPALSGWRLRSERLEPSAQHLLDLLRSGPRLDASLFRERGIQTTSADRPVLRQEAGPLPPGWVRIRAGGDIQEFRLGPPSWRADPGRLSARCRPLEDWRRAAIVIRQTARFPIAAANDGTAFRNSLLAALPNEIWTQGALLAYLNASLLRWFHFHGQRDARQGMPQLKVAHLRALPAPPQGSSLQQLEGYGESLARANVGIGQREREQIDRLVFDMFGLSGSERHLVVCWSQRVPPPRPRRALRPAS